MNLKKITLCDMNGKDMEFTPDDCIIRSDAGFGEAPTATAHLTLDDDGIMLTGDAWRFIEGTLGLELLTQYLEDDLGRGVWFVKEFFDEDFKNAGTDHEALLAWRKKAAGVATERALDAFYGVLGVALGDQSGDPDSNAVNELEEAARRLVMGMLVPLE